MTTSPIGADLPRVTCRKCGSVMVLPHDFPVEEIPPGNQVDGCVICVEQAAAPTREYRAEVTVSRLAGTDADGVKVWETLAAVAHSVSDASIVEALPRISEGLNEKWQRLAQFAAVAEQEDDEIIDATADDAEAAG